MQLILSEERGMRCCEDKKLLSGDFDCIIMVTLTGQAMRVRASGTGVRMAIYRG